MRKTTIILFVLALLLMLWSCSEDGPPEPRTAPAEAVEDAPAEPTTPTVTLATAVTGSLPLRRQTNGKLRARREVQINSQTGGILTHAPTEGAYYKAGATLAATDTRPLELARDRARAMREEAAFAERDLLLRLSTNLAPGDTSVTQLAKDNLLIQSGLPTAEVALAEAEYLLAQAVQTAPFAGTVADVKVQAGRLVSVGEEICTLIDPTSLEAEFTLIEQELATLGENQRVYISPIAQPDLRLSATLDIINPRVDEGGLLRVRARLGKTSGARLYPGMNVTVTLEGNSAPAVLVPKQAVVTRSGRSLVFTYDAASESAQWQYVTVVYENDEQVALSEGVEPGQQVIVSGNLNLDHDSRVRVAVK